MKKPASRSSRTRTTPSRRESLTRDKTGESVVPLSLRAVRLAAGKTQADVSEASGIAQGDVCRLEQRERLDECQVSTLRRFVEALGGQLEVRAVFAKGRRVALTGWDDPDS